MSLKDVFQNVLCSFRKLSAEDQLNEYLASLDYPTGCINLKGPFLSEDYAVHHIDEYKKTLCSSYYTINCRINRRIVVLTEAESASFNMGDNSRIALGIEPFNHEIGLCMREDEGKIDFTVLELDKYLLMNELDRANIKILLLQYPLTEKEVDQWFIKK